MSEKLNLIKDYINELNLRIVSEDEKEELVVVDDPENGIQNLIIDCEPPLVVLEQLIFEVKSESVELYKRLLQMNRTLIHGSFVLDEAGKYVFFRDTLQLEHLDLNELEASVHALSLALAENGNELLDFAKK
jgi:hypothetical protein